VILQPSALPLRLLGPVHAAEKKADVNEADIGCRLRRLTQGWPTGVAGLPII
jgi:hypothetical protein